MTCSSANQTLEKLLKKSLVPLPCQECQLNASCCTTSENMEWLEDLEGKPPIWSRLNEINTSGFRRKLPMSMTNNYDIEIEGRLWSLWAHERRVKLPPSQSKSYMAITVMALCAARIINLDIWSTDLMDTIRENGRKFYKKSLEGFNCDQLIFQLENLGNECSLDTIGFTICMKTVVQGYLYSIPLKCQQNLAYALIQFFNSYKVGILECYNRVLGFGIIDGPKGGYYIFDAQSFNPPLFAEGIASPYLLRTNHLQVLLYCLIVSLNVPHMHAAFSLHHVQVNLVQKSSIETKHCFGYSTDSIPLYELPKETYIKPIISLKSPCYIPFEKIVSMKPARKSQSVVCTQVRRDEKTPKQKYKRRPHNITKEEAETSIIKPMVDPDLDSGENLRVKKDFIRIICSNTDLGLTAAETPQDREKEFTYNLLDALIAGKTNCVVFKDF